MLPVLGGWRSHSACFWEVGRPKEGVLDMVDGLIRSFVNLDIEVHDIPTSTFMKST